MANIGFREIADGLRRSIESGQMAPGSPLPSESELIEQHGVSRTTVRRALAVLDDDGLIDVVPGRGRFVRAGAGAPAPVRTDAKYELVAETIRRELKGTDHSPGDRLGTADELADRFGVSAGTATRALEALAQEGLVTSVQGKGWLVGGANRTTAVVEALRSAIVQGRYPVGGNLPGEQALADEFGVARVTVRRALVQLEADGLIEGRPGQRRKVLKPAT